MLSEKSTELLAQLAQEFEKLVEKEKKGFFFVINLF